MPEVNIDITTDKLRVIAATAKRGEFSTKEAEAFLLLYGSALKDHLNATIKEFVKAKLGV